MVSVRGTGPGLDPQGLGRLFEPFYTTKPQALDMGLAISRSIIEAHGGRLWAAATRGILYTTGATRLQRAAVSRPAWAAARPVAPGAWHRLERLRLYG
jgi:C4-dicarboxylate-specific signal transduction histidine kinase